jgi:hypothetical protein
MRIGASMMSHKPHLVPHNSRRNKMPQLGDIFQNVVTKPSDESTAVCQAVGGRSDLINMKCRYFFSFGGCTRPDCRFLHHEPVQDVVFHDGTEKSRFRDATYIPPGPRAEVKIFVGNLPPDSQSAFIVDLASPYGEVKSVRVLPCKLKHTRRCAAIIYMTSDPQADAAIEAINAYIDERGERPYARKEYSRPLDAAPPPQLKRLLQATKVATSQTKAKPTKASMPSTPAPPMPVPASSPKGNAKPVLACDDGFRFPSKTARLSRDAVKMFDVCASIFAPLYDLDDDDDFEDEEEDDSDKEEEEQENICTEVEEESDTEIAALTCAKPEDVADPLSPQPSPTSIIWGAWSDAERRLRVMSPFKMPPPEKPTSPLPSAGWVVSNKRWSDA